MKYPASNTIQQYLADNRCCFFSQQEDDVRHRVMMEAYENAQKSIELLQTKNGVRLWAEWVTDSLLCGCVGKLDVEGREKTIQVHMIIGESFLKLINLQWWDE